MDKILRALDRMWIALCVQPCVIFSFLVFGIEAINVIKVTVNGEAHELPSGCTVSDLLKKLGLDSRALAVEVNHELKPRNLHDVTIIAQGDVLEIVTLVGGG